MIDYKRYPPNWKTEIVPRILKRAENKCELCGLKNKDIVFSIKVWMKAENGKYKYKSIWFSEENDTIRMSQYFWEDVKKVRVVLTIAHLDHDETNWEVEDKRLKAMCQMCHLTYDGKEKQRRIMSKYKK